MFKKNTMKNRKLTQIIFVLLVCVVVVNFELVAQCPMCRMSAESNLNSGGTAAKGLNNGILYIFAFPYVLVSIIGYIWWKNNKKSKLEANGELLNQ